MGTFDKNEFTTSDKPSSVTLIVTVLVTEKQNKFQLFMFTISRAKIKNYIYRLPTANINFINCEIKFGYAIKIKSHHELFVYTHGICSTSQM